MHSGGGVSAWDTRQRQGDPLLGSVACALAPNAGLLIAARAAQGAAAALVAPLSLSLLGASFGPARRGWALGVYGGISGLAVLGGPVVGGGVTQGLAWQWVFWINVPIGLVAIPLVLTRIPESYGPRARVDVPGRQVIHIRCDENTRIRCEQGTRIRHDCGRWGSRDRIDHGVMEVRCLPPSTDDN